MTTHAKRDLHAEITGKLIDTIEANPGEPVLPWRRSGSPLWLYDAGCAAGTGASASLLLHEPGSWLWVWLVACAASLYETMRLFPAVPFSSKISEARLIEVEGVTIPARTRRAHAQRRPKSFAGGGPLEAIEEKPHHFSRRVGTV
jgi:hypothetical protein